MNMRKIFVLLFTVFAVTAHAQTNFVFTPEKPKPGEQVSFTYEPAGDLANTNLPVEVVLYQLGPKGMKADDIVVKRLARKFTGTFTADTAMSFVFLGFSADKKFDNNFNEGYTILLNENDKPRKGAYNALSNFYQYYGSQAGVESNNEKALAAMEKEFELYPETKKKYLTSYVRMQALVKKDDAAKIYQKEIEGLLKAGLKDESDYVSLETLYSMAKLPEQGKMVSNIKKEKFPEGNWIVNDKLSKYSTEKDLEKKKQMLAEIVANVESGDEKWAGLKPNMGYYRTLIARTHMAAKNWPEFKKAVEESGVTSKSELASLYNSAAWEMQKTSDNLPYAEEFARLATAYTKEEWKNTAAVKPDYYTQKQFEKNKEATYAMFADTYAMVLYRSGKYKKGLEVAKESALNINKGQDADQNNTYALLASKALPKKQYIKQIEGFVKDNKGSSEMKDILRENYKSTKKTEEGFEEYITALQKESYLKMLDELRKSMLNEAAPSFALYNLEGKKTDIASLKGKVVVVDFWATWCGPCKASFPGMQQAVTKYKDNPDVKFIFVDTWEKGENKTKNAADFITSNKYSFDVLMDDEDKVVADFKVDGIPTKFVLDKEGKIRFKTVGFGGSDDKLVQELTAMIEMAGSPEKKAF